MAISRVQAEQVAQQYEMAEKVGAMFAEFVNAATEEEQPYVTPAVRDRNCDRMIAWAGQNLPHGVLSLMTIGGWQLALANAKASLAVDPSWRSAAEKKSIFLELYKRISAVQAKEIYAGIQTQLAEEQQEKLRLIGGPEGFKFFVDQE